MTRKYTILLLLLAVYQPTGQPILTRWLRRCSRFVFRVSVYFLFRKRNATQRFSRETIQLKTPTGNLYIQNAKCATRNVSNSIIYSS